MYEFQMRLTLSGGEYGPVQFVGRDVSVEGNAVHVDGDIVAALNEDGLWYFGETGYERFGIRVNLPHLPVITFTDESREAVPLVLKQLREYVAEVELDDETRESVVIVGPHLSGSNALRVRDYNPETGEKSAEYRVVQVRTIYI